MSYPEYGNPTAYTQPRYEGDGEVSAVVRPDATAPDLVYASGNSVEYLSTGAASNGELGLYRWNMGPEPLPTPDRLDFSGAERRSRGRR